MPTFCSFARVVGAARAGRDPRALRRGRHSAREFASVSLNSTPSRNGCALCEPARQLRRHLHALAVEQQHAAGLEAARVHSALGAVHVVDVQLVEHQRPVLAARIEDRALEAELLGADVHRPGELALVEIEAEEAVERGGRQVQRALVHVDLVAVLEVGIAPRAEQPELGRVGEQLVAGGDVDASRRRRRCRAVRGPSRGPASRCPPYSSPASAGLSGLPRRSGRRRRGFRPDGCRARPTS